MLTILVTFASELECDRFHVNLNLLHPAVNVTVEKDQSNSLNFLDLVLLEKMGTGFLTSVYRKPTLLVNKSVRIPSAHEQEQLALPKL